MTSSWIRRIVFALAACLTLAGCTVQAPSMSGHSRVQLYGQIDEGIQVRP